MSKTVDSKVVEMRFDNKNFEKNVKQSMTTLDKLKQALKLDGAINGLTAVEQRANSIKFHGLADTIDKVAEKFSGLSMIGTMAMIRISQSIANVGLNMAKSLSVDNIMSGWQKLQQKANSMSTLISQGYKTNVVEEQLEKLNWFSDETSYNFTDMIDNIAKFTATGKGLEDSVTAMQGIALWAAKSGQNAQKASAAMYQLSQALGAGYMRKEDWKSIQNASMDTAEFRKQTLEVAVAMGKLNKVGEDTYQSLLGNKMRFTQQQFAESLTEGQWFTSDVMMEVYKKYAKASDQMKKAIDIMAEDHNITLTAGQMIRAYDALKNNTFDKFLKEEEIDDKKAISTLKNMVSGFDEFGISTFRAGQEYRTFNDTIDATKDAVSTKWMNIMETLIGNIDAQKKLWTNIGEQFYDWFAAPLDDLQELLNRWVNMGGRDSLHKAISNIGSAIGAITKPIKEAWDEIFPSITAKRLTELTNKFKEFTSHLKISGEIADSIKSIFRAFFSVIKTGLSVVITFGKALFKLIEVFSPLGELIISAVGFLSKWVDKTAEAARNSKWLSNTINIVVEVIKKFANSVENMINKLLSYESAFNFFKGLFNLIKNIGLAIGKFIGGIIRNGDLNQVMKLINSGLISIAIIRLQEMFKSFKGIADNASGILKNIKGVLESYQKDIESKTLIKIAGAVAMLAGSIWILSSIDDVSLVKGIGAMGLVMTELMLCFNVLNKIVKKGVFFKSSSALISLSLSLLILSEAIKKISGLNIDQLKIGLTGLAGAMSVLASTIYLLPDDGKTNKKTKGLIGLSISLLILSVALKKIGSMNITSIITGLSIMLISLGGMSLILSKMNPENALRKSLSMLVLANSLIILAGSLKILGSMSWSEIGRGLTAMAGSLTILTIIMNLLPKNGGIFKSIGLLGAVTSMIVLAGSLKILATMNWEEIKRSLVAMGGTLTMLVVAMKILGNDIGGSLAGAGALFIASAALIDLAIGLKILASIKPDDMVKSLLGLATALTILGVAGLLLSKISGVLLVVAGAAALFGIASVSIGIGLGLIATGISALALSLSAGTTAIVAGLSAIILGILGLIPEIVKTLGLAIAEFCKVIIECAPLIAKSLGVLLLESVKMLKDFVPPIVTAILDLFIQTIKILTDRVPELMVSISELLSAIFKGFMESIQLLDAKTLIGGIACIGMLIIIFHLLAGLSRTAPAAAIGIAAFGLLLIELISVMGLVGKFKGMVNDIQDSGEVLQAVGTAIGKFVGGIIGGFGLGVSDTMPQIATNLSQFMTNLQPFLNGISKVKLDTAIRIGSLAAGILILTYSNFITGLGKLLSIGSSLPKLGRDLSLFMINAKPFIDNAVLINPNMMKGVQSLANAITVLTGANVLNSMSNLFNWFTGDNSFEKFGKEIASLGTSMKNFAKNLGTFGKDKVDSVNASTEAIKALSKIKDIDFGYLKDNSSNITEIGTNMSNFINKLALSNKDTTELAKNNAYAFIELITKFNNVNGDNIKKISNGLKTIGETGINKFVESLSGYSPLTKVSKAISDLINKLLDTMESKRIDVESKFTSIVTSAIDKINGSTMIDKMKTTGKNFAQGFAYGIENNRYLAINAGTNLGNAAYNAAKRAIDAHSPSKKAHKLGNFFGLGFINGIHKYTSNAYSESYNMADEARKGLSNAISKVNDILNDDHTNQPTIRPVLDLTDIESGAGKINGLFNNVNVGSNLNAITFGMRSKGQNGTANDVVSAINKLSSNIGSGGDTYNINGITYDNQSSIAEAIQVLIRAANIERRS